MTLICQRDLHPIALLCHHLLTSHLLYSLAQGYQGSFSPTNLPFNHMTSSVCSSHPAPPLHRALLPPNRIASSPCSSCPPVMSILTPLRTPPLPSVHKKFCWFYHQNRSRIYLSLPPQLTLVQTIITSCPDYCPNWPLCLHPCPPPHQSFLKEAHSFLLPPCYCFHKTVLLVGLAWKSNYLPGRFSQECIATIICLGSRWVGPSKSVWHSDVKVFFEIFVADLVTSSIPTAFPTFI